MVSGRQDSTSQIFVCLAGFLTSSSTTRLYRGPAPRQSVWQFYMLPHMRQSWETMTSVSVGHISDTDPTSRERAATAGGTTANEGTRVFTPDVVYLCWVNIDVVLYCSLLFYCSLLCASLDEMKGIW